MKSLFSRYFKYYLEGYILFRQSIDFIENLPLADLKLGYTLVLISKYSDETSQDSLIELWNKAYYSDDNTAKARTEVLRQLDDGDICSVLIYERKMVGMSWFGFKEAAQRMDFSNIISNEKQFLLTHHVFILPIYRGWAAQRFIFSFGVNQIRQNYDINNLFVFVGMRNFASMRNSERDYAESRAIYHLKIEIPFFSFNVYPKKSQNTWRPCGK